MFKANCDICGRVVTKLEDLKQLESTLAVKDMQHICNTCGATFSGKLKDLGTAHNNQLTTEAKDWLLERHKLNKPQVLT